MLPLTVSVVAFLPAEETDAGDRDGEEHEAVKGRRADDPGPIETASGTGAVAHQRERASPRNARRTTKGGRSAAPRSSGKL